MHEAAVGKASTSGLQCGRDRSKNKAAIGEASTSRVVRRRGQPRKLQLTDSSTDDEENMPCANCDKLLSYVITNIKSQKCPKKVHFVCCDNLDYFVCKNCLSEPDNDENEVEDMELDE